MGVSSVGFRPTVAEVSADAIRANCAAFVRLVAPSVVCAVVKADGYGHGSVTAARAALHGGATMLAVALVEEALVLREAGIDAPILVLSEPPVSAASTIVSAHIDTAAYSSTFLSALAEAAQAESAVASVHLKIDTGMHRVGAATSDAVALASQIASSASLRLAGTFTHFAASDEPDSSYTALQLQRFNVAVAEIRAAGIAPGVVHTCNSAGALVHRDAWFDMVRVGVSLYGNEPGPLVHLDRVGIELSPVLTLRSAVSFVKVVTAGETVSYGRTWTAPSDRVIATAPVGYADGIPRRLSSVGGCVLIGGRRCPIVGRVTMDQLLIDVGASDDAAAQSVARGDEVVLLGAQGNERITPWEWASLLDTIAYEITCGISARVPRTVV